MSLLIERDRFDGNEIVFLQKRLQILKNMDKFGKNRSVFNKNDVVIDKTGSV